ADELSPDVQLYVGLGDELTSRLRYDAAAREYTRAADIARREGHLASGTMWMLATAHYYNGNLVGAAAALDQLTDEAARVGDLEVEALSIYYAAWLNGKAGRGLRWQHGSRGSRGCSAHSISRSRSAIA